METEQAPPNQSPDTQDEPVEEVDLGKMVSDAVEEATKPLKEEIESLKKGSTPSSPSTKPSESTPTPPAVSDPPSAATLDVDRAVERALADRDHAAQHAALAEVGAGPKKKERKGFGRIMWGDG